jgi:hypothetical protein
MIPLWGVCIVAFLAGATGAVIGLLGHPESGPPAIYWYAPENLRVTPRYWGDIAMQPPIGGKAYGWTVDFRDPFVETMKVKRR